MNTQVQAAQNTATVIFDDQQGRDAFTMANLVFNPSAMQAVNQLAEMLANNSGMVPNHFNGKPGDLIGVIMQAGRWGMDPIAVAQSTFVLQGRIGYEAKLMQAVARANGGIDFDPEYYGNWDRVQGNFTVKQGQNNKKYNSPNWNPNDEQGVGLKLVGTFPDGKTREIDVPLKTCHPRNSTNWANDPQQQIYYTAVKRWIRRYAPHLGLGIQDYDDLAARQSEPVEREINPIQRAQPKPQAQVKRSEPQGIDDLLGDQQTQTTTTAQQTVVEPGGIDDLLGGDTLPAQSDDDGVYIPSKYDEMVDLLHGSNTEEDYWQARSSCIEVMNSGELTGEQMESLKKSLNTLRDSLGIPPAEK